MAVHRIFDSWYVYSIYNNEGRISFKWYLMLLEYFHIAQTLMNGVTLMLARSQTSRVTFHLGGLRRSA